MGSYLRLIDFVYHSTLGLRVIKKKKYGQPGALNLLAALRGGCGLKLYKQLFRRDFYAPEKALSVRLIRIPILIITVKS